MRELLSDIVKESLLCRALNHSFLLLNDEMRLGALDLKRKLSGVEQVVMLDFQGFITFSERLLEALHLLLDRNKRARVWFLDVGVVNDSFISFLLQLVDLLHLRDELVVVQEGVFVNFLDRRSFVQRHLVSGDCA